MGHPTNPTATSDPKQVPVYIKKHIPFAFIVGPKEIPVKDLVITRYLVGHPILPQFSPISFIGVPVPPEVAALVLPGNPPAAPAPQQAPTKPAAGSISGSETDAPPQTTETPPELGKRGVFVFGPDRRWVGYLSAEMTKEQIDMRYGAILALLKWRDNATKPIARAKNVCDNNLVFSYVTCLKELDQTADEEKKMEALGNALIKPAPFELKDIKADGGKGLRFAVAIEDARKALLAKADIELDAIRELHKQGKISAAKARLLQLGSYTQGSDLNNKIVALRADLEKKQLPATASAK